MSLNAKTDTYQFFINMRYFPINAIEKQKIIRKYVFKKLTFIITSRMLLVMYVTSDVLNIFNFALFDMFDESFEICVYRFCIQTFQMYIVHIKFYRTVMAF